MGRSNQSDSHSSKSSLKGLEESFDRVEPEPEFETVDCVLCGEPHELLKEAVKTNPPCAYCMTNTRRPRKVEIGIDPKWAGAVSVGDIQKAIEQSMKEQLQGYYYSTAATATTPYTYSIKLTNGNVISTGGPHPKSCMCLRCDYDRKFEEDYDSWFSSVAQEDENANL